MAATALGDLRDQVEAGGQFLGFVAVRHPDGKVLWAGRRTGASRSSISTSAWPYSRLSAARTLPPSACTMNCSP